jgi:hypothetical protein
MFVADRLLPVTPDIDICGTGVTAMAELKVAVMVTAAPDL